jgi:hypothetical protein
MSPPFDWGICKTGESVRRRQEAVHGRENSMMKLDQALDVSAHVRPFTP